MKKSIVAISTLAVLSSTFVSPALANSYTVKSGDTLSKIAQKHKTTVKELKLLNNLQSDMLKINQKIITSKSQTTTTKTKATTSSVSVEKTKNSTYTIVPGDTLTKIANKHNLTLAELKNLNNLKSDMIYAGNKLIVSSSKTTTTIDLPSSAKPANISTPKVNLTSNTYIIVKGDTLSKIANKHNLTLAELKKLNNLKSDLIYAGNKLIVSSSKTTTTIDLPSSAKPANISTPKVNLTSNTYIVVKGDTLSKIAKQSNISVAELKSYNSLTSDIIRIGQKLSLVKSVTPASTVGTPEKVTYSNNKVNTLISEAKKLIGTPYSWAGASPSGFDCSGFIYYTFKKAGYEISRLSSSTYYDMGKKVSSPKAGDLVFFATGSSKSIVSHMGIYLGNGQFIHASSSNGIEINNVSNSYYKSKLIGYRSL
ncbi:LysM peptidoglycan-binding domain-containing protein [Peribacillus sp. NPDC097264]|uniref:C40 family peptidase n=1 Tax=Peribacillus sp. NPDC097264 TaxID=3390616 RepID=UPI003D022D18